jgi:hypothetical protein
METRTILRTFNYRHEAEFFRSLLDANGIESFVVSDDCGSWDPALGFARGVNLILYRSTGTGREDHFEK